MTENAIMTGDTTQLFDVIASAVDSNELQRVILSQPTRRSTSTAGRVDIRPVTLQGQRVYQWSRQLGNQAFHENHSPQETLDALQKSIGHEYRHIHLTVHNEQWSARFSRRGNCRLIREKHATASPAVGAHMEHDRKRHYLIPDGQPVPFLVQTGIMTPNGQVRSKHYHKFRQINRYVELIADVVDRLPSDGVIRIVDFGCGKSYLTFATHHYLTRVAQRTVEITGLDRRSDVVHTCQQIAESLKLNGIQFQQGDIFDFEPTDQVHLNVSLHACDTATDDALTQAVRWKTDVILAVPCCQHELNATMKDGQIPLLSQHGILQERFCSLATDAIRAAVLEQAGYQSQILEFIETEHTAKNLLIRAVRRPAEQVTSSQTAATELQQFHDLFRIPVLHFERRLQEPALPLSVTNNTGNDA